LSLCRVILYHFRIGYQENVNRHAFIANPSFYIRVPFPS
jgi:hypothetical protein